MLFGKKAKCKTVCMVLLKKDVVKPVYGISLSGRIQKVGIGGPWGGESRVRVVGG